MNDSEMLDFLGEYVDSYAYIHPTNVYSGYFLLEVAMVGEVRSTVSLRDAIEQSNEEMQKVNS